MQTPQTPEQHIAELEKELENCKDVVRSIKAELAQSHWVITELIAEKNRLKEIVMRLSLSN
ncbi:MAG TPA: hypothetical protein VJ044_07965 [Candidatus Hodarchaeales archaeon]|nr:hypothetical protein [Candidatus Hodarchaeales archaeon]